MLSNPIIVPLAIAACLIPSCLPAEPYAGVLERLRRITPPPRQSLELKARVIASLPKEGEVTVLTAVERHKLESLEPVLRAHGREGEYLFKVVESRQARLGLHARFVVLITDTALKVLTPGQLQAVVAHEIGHDYTWDEYQAAQKTSDWARIRELELFCDGFAVITLARMGVEPSTLIDALRIMLASDQANGITFDPIRNSHPSISERARFGKEVAKRLAGGFSPAENQFAHDPGTHVGGVDGLRIRVDRKKPDVLYGRSVHHYAEDLKRGWLCEGHRGGVPG